MNELVSQTFPCDGTMLLSHNNGNAPQQLNQVRLAPFNTVIYTPIQLYSGGQFNGLGFNPKDNYIYAVEANSNNIVRLRSDNKFELVGSTTAIPELSVSAGDCTADGLYVCQDSELDQLLFFDVVDKFEMLHQIDLYWDSNSKNSGRVTTKFDDLVMDPNNPKVAYAFQGDYFDDDLEPFETRNFLHKINVDLDDPQLGTVTPLVRVSNSEIRQLGSLMFTKEGILHGYGSKSNSANLRQNTLVQINIKTGATSEILGNGPTGSSTDGCSCPYALTFENDAFPRDVLCTDSEITFRLTARNRFFQSFGGITLSDTIPEGMVISAIRGDHNGNTVDGSGVGTRHVTITDIEIPAKGEVVVDIVAKILDIEIDFNHNQAHLKNLPVQLGGNMLSDDPQSPLSSPDDTEFLVFAQRLEKFNLEIDNPIDCLDPNTGKATLSSPVLVPGEAYNIKMRNEEFEDFSWNVTIDDSNTFYLEDLAPGEYRLSQLSSSSVACSFTMKDTTINIVAPNEQVQANARSNSPICEGADLELNATMSPEGIITWKDPGGSIIEGADYFIHQTSSFDSGRYEMIATYGGCEQIRTLEVVVAPAIDASIRGKDQYCERDDLLLIAQGEGKQKTFEWVGPEMNLYTNDTLFINSLQQTDGGTYQLIIDNGVCQDTITKNIEILVTPSVSLPFQMKTDFCGSIILDPEITGESNASYQWFPQAGLSCIDCPSPELLIPVQDQYSLIVSNGNSCRDSTAIIVRLSNDNLIYTPNIFSPNADKDNDFFQLSPGCATLGIKAMAIYDRWGHPIFSKSEINHLDETEFWDGTIDGKQAAQGVYLWTIEIELVNGESKRLFGEFTLVR